MNPDYLDFEQPIARLQAQIDELRMVSDKDINLADDVLRLEEKVESLTKSIFSKLSAKQVGQIARHPKRPYTLDVVEGLCTDFQELHGDRSYADDHAMVGGIARFEGRPVMVIGHQKGRDTKENIRRNFGMSRPEGYRKALRLLRLAEKFHLPVLTFIDTAGAYPGIGAEERGQSEAIARNLFEMARLKTPVIVTVMGEGGSGGALAIGVGDVVMMMQYATYSVISPEGCASILWKSASKAAEAAEAMGITANKLYDLGLVDRIVPEPLGGAHRNYAETFANLKEAIASSLREVGALNTQQLLDRRYDRLMSYGQFEA
ncbi:MAG: acetyl-CoA carboxylase carboxyl transferase subunit alpha [Proteobacteria bacterium]|nr:MAG: acetyl-CoA carboxylase carboxyl transferase subunit alpha [Pseudomonadota bacterium]